MPVTNEIKRERLRSLRSEAAKDVEAAHRDLMPRVAGWAWNKWRALRSASNTGKTRTTLGGAGLAAVRAALPLPPVLGPLLGAAMETAANRALKAAAESTGAVADEFKLDVSKRAHIKAAGEHLAASGASALHDAVRKVDDAERELKPTFRNCEEFAKQLRARARYTYRLDRLAAYLLVMRRYVDFVEEQLDQKRKRWAEKEAEMDAMGPAFFDKWEWHFDNCSATGICAYPWSDLEVSAPFGTEVSGSSHASLPGRPTTSPAGPASTRGGAVGPPKLPPRR